MSCWHDMTAAQGPFSLRDLGGGRVFFPPRVNEGQGVVPAHSITGCPKRICLAILADVDGP